MSETAVPLLLFNRPDFTHKLIAEVKKYSPSRAYNHCDGPRVGNNFDTKKCLLANQFEDLLPWRSLFLEYCTEKEVEIEAEEKQILKAVKTYLGLQLFGENTFRFWC